MMNIEKFIRTENILSLSPILNHPNNQLHQEHENINKFEQVQNIDKNDYHR